MGRTEVKHIGISTKNSRFRNTGSLYPIVSNLRGGMVRFIGDDNEVYSAEKSTFIIKDKFNKYKNLILEHKINDSIANAMMLTELEVLDTLLTDTYDNHKRIMKNANINKDLFQILWSDMQCTMRDMINELKEGEK